MKYIRTKDEVIDISNMQEYEADDDKDNRIFDGYGYDNSPIYYPIENIIKQADTIEELCDEFVYSDNDFKNVIYGSLEPIRILIKLLSRINFQVYGAIWTDKGLIYVAKMNEKGELELL